MLSRKQLCLFLVLYILIRVFSYFFSPETPLYAANPVNTIVSLAILLTTLYLLLTKNAWGWYIIALEIILGGAGGYLAVGPLSLRTTLLLASILIFFGYKIKDHQLKNLLKENKTTGVVFSLLYFAVFIAALRGYFAGHNLRLIFSDAIPYLFLLYYFPLKELLANNGKRDSSTPPTKSGSVGMTIGMTKKTGFIQIVTNTLYAAIIGNLLLLALTFIGFSSGLFALQDSYYHWYRDVALGKITELPFNFYRLVLNEHLILVPIMLWLLHRVIARSDERATKQSTGFQNQPGSVGKGIASLHFVSLAMTLVILSLNLTRIYLLALAVGYLFLFSKTYWKRWLVHGILAGAIFIVSFTSIHLIASRGQSLGWELFGLRLQSIASPQIEDSSLSRLLLLPKILDKIKAYPLLGTGLGDTVTVFSPVFKTDITTPHFDWGYLEILAEMGIIGLITWLLLIVYLFIILKKSQAPRWQYTSLGALLVINLTSPALFHVLGIILLTYLLSIHQCRDKTKLQSV
ncbi:MAG: O-antigen ligase family protein [Candidatus Magasanikbacteria bacterium]|nr:O-antigen ligase family protein [Candidatus Magasanikbacteria bacterium]